LDRDAHAVVADPLFVDPADEDFRFKNEKVIRKIKFRPFDYSKAGVYGSDEWKQKAQMPADLVQQFQMVKQRFIK
jgi:hypothetical protein